MDQNAQARTRVHRSAYVLAGFCALAGCSAQTGRDREDSAAATVEAHGTMGSDGDGMMGSTAHGAAGSPSGSGPAATSNSPGTMSSSSTGSAAGSGSPAGGATMSDDPGVFEPVLARDDNALANVVEIDLEALEADIEISPGRRVSMWTYNGVLPGPRIEARVGDTLRVHFTNSLPEETTIHWHGLRVPADMDGATVTHAAIQPGETFTYEFVVEDAGTFWYHPHVRADEQVERGLYGAIVVRGPDEPKTTTERVVVLDDVLLGSDGQLAPFAAMHAMMGREGNVILVNGHVLPSADVAPSGLHRFRFVNVANARYFRLALPGHELLLVGRDGSLLERPESVQDLLLVPGQRADILVRVQSQDSEPLAFRSLPYDRGHAMMMSGSAMASDSAFDLFSLRKTGAQVTPLDTPGELRVIEPLPAASVQRELKLEESMGMAGGGSMGGGHMGGHTAAPGGGMEAMGMTFSINGEAYPDVTPLQAKLGAVEDWSVVNTTEMDHPFHLHGFRFQVLSVDGMPPSFRAWEDTVNVKAKQTVKLRVSLEDHPGTWMFHCHILEHAERGMMGELLVSP